MAADSFYSEPMGGARRTGYQDPWIERDVYGNATIHIKDFIEECWNEQPVTFGFAWGSGLIAFLIVFVIIVKHICKLNREAVCQQKEQYQRIAAYPLVFALANAACLADPRTLALWELVEIQYEALTLMTFGAVLFTLVSLESRRLLGDEGKNLVAGERVIVALARSGPRKHFAVPPLGCWFASCCREHDLTARQLLRIMRLIRQFVVIAPVTSVFWLWTALAMNSVTATALRLYVKAVLKISTIVAVYGLFVTYGATKDLLHNWNTTKKFFVLKAPLLLIVLQDLIVSAVIDAVSGGGVLCGVHATFLWPEAVHESLARFWSRWLTTIECIGLALLVTRAFPAEEIAMLGEECDLTYGDLVLDLETQKKETSFNESTLCTSAESSEPEASDEPYE
jgi:hypothetical protein